MKWNTSDYYENFESNTNEQHIIRFYNFLENFPSNVNTIIYLISLINSESYDRIKNLLNGQIFSSEK